MGGNESGDAIHIRELEVLAHIGVPEEERAIPQRLTVSLVIWPQKGFHELDDQLEKTVNYAAVCRELKALSARQSNKLIETLAEEMAAFVLRTFAVQKVQIELRKFILPDVRYVAVTLTRERNLPP